MKVNCFLFDESICIRVEVLRYGGDIASRHLLISGIIKGFYDSLFTSSVIKTSRSLLTSVLRAMASPTSPPAL